MTFKRNYSTILFDLFDTLILFRPTLLPKLNVNGVEHYSTAVPVFRVFKKYFARIGFNDFYNSFKKSYEEFQLLKMKENREFTNKIRFDMMFTEMGISGADSNEESIKNQLVLAHMKSLSESMIFPENHRRVLETIRRMEYRTCIVSNFDHAPTAYKLLDKFRITGYFEMIFISDEIGWRKPDPIIFNKVLGEMKAEPEETILIGDNYNDDIKGAYEVGIDSVLVERKKTDNNSLAKYVISELSQLPGILEH